MKKGVFEDSSRRQGRLERTCAYSKKGEYLRSTFPKPILFSTCDKIKKGM